MGDREPDYRIRPAKCIERKMLCDALRRLSEFGSLSAYRYIGFGAFYFADFVVFHKNLGITDMISIEGDVANGARYRFNRPFDCIEVELGHSNSVLPKLSWDKRTILWLDYTSRLDQSVLTDVSMFCAEAARGSVLIVTVNAKPDDVGKGRLKLLKKRVGEENIPLGVSEKSLSHWGTAAVSRKILDNEIRNIIRTRNGGLSPGNKMQYTQLFNFRYEDGAKMLTVGGVFWDEGQQRITNACAFEQFAFIRHDEKAFLIDVPRLTLHEMRCLDQELPTGDPTQIAVPVSDASKRRYAELYRYFPRFTESDI